MVDIRKEVQVFLIVREGEEMAEWVGTVERYDDPDIDDPEEIWGL